MKFLVSGIGLLLLGCAHAVFDLQQVSRFSSSNICRSSFSAVEPIPGGGFLVAGTVSDDILLAEFDSFGALVRTGIYDSPLVKSDTPVSIHRYSDGRVLLNTSDGTQSQIVQFSSGFYVNWELVRNATQVITALDGSGNAHLFGLGVAESISPAGTSQGVTSLPNFNPRAASGRPGVTGEGALVVGNDTSLNRPCVIRVAANAAQIYRSNDATGAASSSSNYSAVLMESTGQGLLGGFAAGSGLALYSLVSPGGGVTSATLAGRTSGLTQVVSLSSTEAMVFGEFTGAIRVAKATGAVLAASAVGQFRGFGVLDTAQRAILFQPDGFMNVIQLSNGSQVNGFTSPSGYRDASAISPTQVAGVGSPDTGINAMLTISNGLARVTQTFQFAGGPRRVPNASVSFPDGSVAVLSGEQLGAGNRPAVVRYRPDGSLVYARGIAVGAIQYSTGTGLIARFSDSAVAVVGQSANAPLWTFARLNSAGVVTANQVITDFESFRPQRIVALADGSTAVLGINSTDDMVLYVMSSTGAVLLRTFFDEADAIFGIAEPIVNGAGHLVVTVKAGGSALSLTINPFNGISTTPIIRGTGVTDVLSSRDPGGNLVVGFLDNGALILERRDPTSLNLLNSRNAGTAQGLPALTVAPNGATLALCRQVGDDQLKFFGPGGFPDVASSTLVSTVTQPLAVAVDATNVAYIVGVETVGATQNVYSARYLANGVRSAQRRSAGTPLNVHVAGSGVWITGEVGTRKKGRGPFAARYSL